MFNYRHRQLADDLAAQARARAIYPDPLTVAITGSGSLIGTVLAALLTGVDVLIHLAGASIGGRFTPDRKREIRDSRTTPTRRGRPGRAARHRQAVAVLDRHRRLARRIPAGHERFRPIRPGQRGRPGAGA
jgi:hypothetical protein